MNESAAQIWLERRVTARQDVQSALVMLDVNSQLQPAADWPKGLSRDPQVLAAAHTAFKDGRFVKLESKDGTVVSKPLSEQGRIVGSVAMRLREAGKERRAANQGEFAKLQPDSAKPPGLAPNKVIEGANGRQLGSTGNRSNQLTVLELLDLLLEPSSLSETATQMVTELATSFAFDRVSIGLADNSNMQLVAVSHSADIQTNQSLSESLQSIMEEALDQSSHLVFPVEADSPSKIVLHHQEHSTRQSVGQVLTFLLTNQGVSIGALVCERKIFSPIVAEQSAMLMRLVESLGPVLELKRDLERSFFHRTKAKVRLRWEQLASAQHRSFKVMVGLLVLGLFALPALPIQQRLTTQARVEGQFLRALVAPNDGYLKLVHARPGDSVKAGQVLVELADEDLLIERRKIESELSRYESSVGEALGKQDRSQLLSAQARANESRSQLHLIDQQLERSKIVSPIDGLVTKGDLKQKLGAPVKRGDSLLSVAPNGGFRIIAEVPDRRIDEVKIGQSGKVVLSALPKDQFAFEVVRILPVANQKDGRNFFEIEGRLQDETSTLLRPGMEGVAKIEIGSFSIYASAGTRLLDWTKINLWSFWR
jgi:multidrug resistance efflux pump